MRRHLDLRTPFRGANTGQVLYLDDISACPCFGLRPFRIIFSSNIDRRNVSFAWHWLAGGAARTGLIYSSVGALDEWREANGLSGEVLLMGKMLAQYWNCNCNCNGASWPRGAERLSNVYFAAGGRGGQDGDEQRAASRGDRNQREDDYYITGQLKPPYASGTIGGSCAS